MISIWWKLWIFQVFLVHFLADVGFWANNGDWRVNLRGVGDIGKKNTSKNEYKLA